LERAVPKNLRIRLAEASEAGIVAQFVVALIGELFPSEAAALDELAFAKVAQGLLQSPPRIWALLAIAEDGEPVGVLTLNECAAIYAGGISGEITEIYVKPEYRSSCLGARLVDAAVAFGRNRHWTRLEVGAPDVTRWRRTVDFYLGHGFQEVGPRLRYFL
jgi:GNAT superfamily N-acetyltransferase